MFKRFKDRKRIISVTKPSKKKLLKREIGKNKKNVKAS